MRFGPWIILDKIRQDFIWQFMAIHGNSWQLMVTHDNWAAGTFENWCGAWPHGLRAGREVAEGHQMQNSWLEVVEYL